MERPVLRWSAVLGSGLGMILLSQAGPAAAGDQAVRTVTLEEAVASADRAPEMIAAHAGEQAAEAGVRVARALPDPEVSLTTNSINAQEALSVLLPLPWLRGAHWPAVVRWLCRAHSPAPVPGGTARRSRMARTA